MSSLRELRHSNKERTEKEKKRRNIVKEKKENYLEKNMDMVNMLYIQCECMTTLNVIIYIAYVPKNPLHQ